MNLGLLAHHHVVNLPADGSRCPRTAFRVKDGQIFYGLGWVRPTRIMLEDEQPYTGPRCLVAGCPNCDPPAAPEATP